MHFKPNIQQSITAVVVPTCLGNLHYKSQSHSKSCIPLNWGHFFQKRWKYWSSCKSILAKATFSLLIFSLKQWDMIKGNQLDVRNIDFDYRPKSDKFLLFTLFLNFTELVISLQPNVWLRWGLEQDVPFQMDKLFFMKNQNWMSLTCDSFPWFCHKCSLAKGTTPLFSKETEIANMDL